MGNKVEVIRVAYGKEHGKMSMTDMVLKSDHDRELAALRLEVKMLREKLLEEHKSKIGVCFETSFKSDEEHMQWYEKQLDQEITKAVEGLKNV